MSSRLQIRKGIDNINGKPGEDPAHSTRQEAAPADPRWVSGGTSLHRAV
jgi:hypothetical protein